MRGNAPLEQLGEQVYRDYGFPSAGAATNDDHLLLSSGETRAGGGKDLLKYDQLLIEQDPGWALANRFSDVRHELAARPTLTRLDAFQNLATPAARQPLDEVSGERVRPFFAE